MKTTEMTEEIFYTLQTLLSENKEEANSLVAADLSARMEQLQRMKFSYMTTSTSKESV
jgi:hypothetical protein